MNPSSLGHCTMLTAALSLTRPEWMQNRLAADLRMTPKWLLPGALRQYDGGLRIT